MLRAGTHSEERIAHVAKRKMSMGEAVDYCVKITTEEWFRQHRGLRTREEALAEDVQLVSATCERRPGGRLVVHVGVVCRSRQATVSDAYSFYFAHDLGYVEQAEA